MKNTESSQRSHFLGDVENERLFYVQNDEIERIYHEQNNENGILTEEGFFGSLVASV